MFRLRGLLHKLLIRILFLSAGQLAQTNDSANHTVRKSAQMSPHRQKAVGPILRMITQEQKILIGLFRGSWNFELRQKESQPLEVALEKMAALSARSNTLCLRC